jgi:hypothetical protein
VSAFFSPLFLQKPTTKRREEKTNIGRGGKANDDLTTSIVTAAAAAASGCLNSQHHIFTACFLYVKANRKRRRINIVAVKGGKA